MARSKPAPIGRDATGDYFTFGKHAYFYVRWVAQNDRSYLNWILGRGDFPDSVKVACRKAIEWAASRPGQWSGPPQAERAAETARSKFMADVDRIWKD
jgi:hypothetical protein